MFFFTYRIVVFQIGDFSNVHLRETFLTNLPKPLY